MNQIEVKKLLKRFEEGNCTVEEERLLNAWFDKLSYTETLNLGDKEQRERAIRLKSLIDAQIENTGRRFVFTQTLLKTAALLVLISTICFFSWKERLAIRDLLDPVNYLQSATKPGERIKIKLADGTVVWLNAASKIRYPEEFNRDTRQVELLEGEAFFDVVHDKKKPFVVLAGKTRTQVLGTAFNIRSYAVFDDIKVTVAHGKVAVSESGPQGKQLGNAVFLLPNDQLSFNRKTGAKSKIHTQPNTVTSWTNGRLFFNNDSLKYVAEILGNAFDIKMTFSAKDIESIRVTATFDTRDTLKEILFAIAKSNALEYSQNGNHIVFRKKTN